MKTIIQVLLSVTITGLLLAGCYSKSCDQPMNSSGHNYKGEMSR